MTRRWKILLYGSCGVISVVAVCFFCLRENEPSYDGRTLSEWLERCDPHLKYPPGSGVEIGDLGSQAEREARDAVRTIGTNAGPILVRWSNAENTAVQRSVRKGVEACFGGREPLWLQRYLWSQSAEKKRWLAFTANMVIGSQRAIDAPEPRF